MRHPVNCLDESCCEGRIRTLLAQSFAGRLQAITFDVQMLLREAEALRHADYQTATGVRAFHQTLPSHLRPRRAKHHCSRQRPKDFNLTA
jgi:hypothetical protein